MPGLAAFVAGLLFALGLGLGGMTQPAKVIGFLDVLGPWDPSLALVMCAALATHALTLRLVLRRERPLFAARFLLPTRRDIDGRLVAGAALFGVGWGMVGYCPGPAITALGAGRASALVFVPAMLAGMLLHRVLERPEAVRRAMTASLVVAAVLLAPGLAAARCGSPACRGMGQGPGGPQHDADHAGFQFLLAHREQIHRTVSVRPDGVETLTESDAPDVAAAIVTHVRAMAERMKTGRPIHARDPLFAAIFQNAEAITVDIQPTEHGARVLETSTDPWVAKLIQAHAEVVTQFLEHGHAEMRRDHAVPPRAEVP